MSIPEATETERAAQPSERPYPPCLFKAPDEKRLYQRLREIYEQHSDTWDKESRDAWPSVVEQASLAPSTIRKVTSHTITKNLTDRNVTWAHVVVLRVIFKTMLYKSKKTMKIIMNKYPRANFHTYAFNESYRLPLVVATAGLPGSTVQKGVGENENENDVPSPQKWSKAKSSTQNREEENQAKSVFLKKEPKSSVIIKREVRDESPTAGFLNIQQHPKYTAIPPAKKRKRTTPGDGDQDQKPGSNPKPKKPARKPAGSSKTTAKAPVVETEAIPPQKPDVPVASMETAPLAKRGSSRKDASKDASKPVPTSGTGIENRLKDIQKRLRGQDTTIRDLRQQVATQADQIELLRKRIKEQE